MSKSNEEIIEEVFKQKTDFSIDDYEDFKKKGGLRAFIKDAALRALQVKDEAHRKEKINLVLSLPEWDENKSDYENPYGEKIEINSEWKDERLKELSEVEGEHEHIYRSSNLGWGQRKLKCLVCDGRDDD